MAIIHSEISHAVAQLMREHNIVRFSFDTLFQWSSGIESPIYCDNRLFISQPDARDILVTYLMQAISLWDEEYDVIAGTATAGIPWASYIADRLKKPMVYIRSKPKKHGAGKMIEGYMPEHARVLIIEDLIATGGSSLLSVQAAQKEYKAEIVGVLALFEYGFVSTKKRFEAASVRYHTLSNLHSLIDVSSFTEKESQCLREFLARH